MAVAREVPKATVNAIISILPRCRSNAQETIRQNI
jgi:hypothetical protein